MTTDESLPSAVELQLKQKKVLSTKDFDTAAQMSVQNDHQPTLTAMHTGNGENDTLLVNREADTDELSSEDYVELTRISRKKDDIEHHIANLQSWPAWKPFRNITSYSADPLVLQRNRDSLQGLRGELRDRQDECDRLERDVQQFNLEDMKRLRAVAKAVSKRQLSGSDTDLLELALETVYALDKLLRLLREHRAEHDLTELRLKWEATLISGWEEVAVLRHDIDAFDHKCQALLPPRRSVSDQLDPDTLPIQSMYDTGMPGASVNGTTKRRSASTSLPSLKLAAESIKLESSRLVLRIKSFDSEKVKVAGRLLDLLIDQRQVPETMIDEQEKLEEALPQPTSIESAAARIEVSIREIPASNGTSQTNPSLLTAGPSIESQLVDSDEAPSESVRELSTVTAAGLPVAAQQSPRRIPTNRSHQASVSSMPKTPAKNVSNRYRPNPRNALDVAVGNVVNRMPMAVSIKSAGLADVTASHRSSDVQDLSGQYWIGDPEPRLCFCRILPSSLVMVRVGGGWQELSSFITQHYAHLSAQGMQNNESMPGTPRGQAGSQIAWLRSASGPAASPRQRLKSSGSSPQLRDSMRLSTPQPSSRIVTMPAMSRTEFALSPARPQKPRRIPSMTPKQPSIDQTDTDSTSEKVSELPSSSSGSSIVIHPSSPSA